QKIFGFDSSTMTLRKEVIGGITTFLTMAYILAVNPTILSAAGMDAGAIFTTTCLSAVIATFVMAIYAKLPFALAPGMGLNAFFAFTVVLTMGYTWQFALTAVLIEGIIFILLTITGMRKHIVNAIPLVLRRAISPGIGLFIAFVGLKSAGIVTSSESTFITLGNMHEAGVLLSIFGILLTSALLVRKVTGALLIGILVTTAIGIPLGITNFTGIISAPPSIEPIFWKFEFHNVFTVDMVIVVLTFLFIDMFDTIGTLIGVSNRAGMVDENDNVKNINQAFMADAIGTTVGSMLGTSTVTVYVESASGVNVGGRSGLTSFITAICFAAALLFAPLFLAIPAQATASALILVGVMMMYEVRKVDFSDYVTGIPCFVCIVLMPLTYSISDGILMGVISYVLIHLCSGRLKDKDERNNMNWATILLAALFICKYAFL
ncbi:MAG: NCS2 family permease, partial [Prevotella sp.]|nr:NCS2 family permease [Prevotella sp.]